MKPLSDWEYRKLKKGQLVVSRIEGDYIGGHLRRGTVLMVLWKDRRQIGTVPYLPNSDFKVMKSVGKLIQLDRNSVCLPNSILVE